MGGRIGERLAYLELLEGWTPPSVVVMIGTTFGSIGDIISPPFRYTRPLTDDPFADVGRTVSKFNSTLFKSGKRPYGIPIHDKHFLQIDSDFALLLPEDFPQHLDVLRFKPAAHPQDD